MQSVSLSRQYAALFITFLLAALLGGCSSDQGMLRLSSQDGHREFSQKFSQAFIAHNGAGDTDIVLVQADSTPAKPNAPELPRQLLHIRVFWTPMNGVKPDHPVNTNASIHWCLICDNSDRSGVIDYQGPGLVDLTVTSDGADVTIRKAWMKAALQCGQLVDPLGPSILRGSFHAVHDPSQVRTLLAQIKFAQLAAEKMNSPMQAKTASASQPKHLVVN